MTNIQDSTDIGRRYVFICGLHRSGTSLLGRNIARLENCTGFNDTGVVEDEGQFLQDVYPLSKAYGGAGKFGFDPRAHLMETSPLVTPHNALKLRQSWERYWDPGKTICVEKTPGNLLKTRFLQAMFPNAYFIAVRRHPVSVSMANQKWKMSFAPLHKLFDHWLCCHGLFEEDKKYLKRVYELTYEDYIRNPDYYYQEIARFIGTRVPEQGMEEVTGVYNQKYFKGWCELLNNSRLKGYYRYIAVKYETMFNKYGYSLTKGFDGTEGWLDKVARLSVAWGVLYCLIADIYAFWVRSMARSRASVKKQLRACLPESFKLRIQRVVRKTSVIKNRADVISP